MVGAAFNTQHGLTNTILLPEILRLNLPGQKEKVGHMVQAMGLPDTSVEGIIWAVEILLHQIGIPKSLGEIGVPFDCTARIAEKALKDSTARTTPRAATLAEIVTLSETAISKAR